MVVALVTWAAPKAFARMDERSEQERKQEQDRARKKELKLVWQRRKRWLLIAALLVPFGMLAYLKYWNVILYQVGAAASATSLGLVLPLGISFYTFQSVGYLIDAYNGTIELEPSLARHLLFVTYFPQMIQGPINRYAALAPQLFARHRLSEVSFGQAGLRIGYGMLKKFVMADLLVDLIEKLLASVGVTTPGSLVVIAILLYSAQQYGDFSGGIDMVEGYSELLCIEMAPNFKRPYFSVSLADFWRRWHISLGQWMRDYVFYPFVLSRSMRSWSKNVGKRLGRHLSKIILAGLGNILVFLLVGIWHGAELHFLAWGFYNGAVIALSDILAPQFARLAERLHVDVQTRGYHVFAIIRTFIVVNIGWYFDRITDVGTSVLCLGKTFFDFSPQRLPEALAAIDIRPADYAQLALALTAAAVVFVVSLVQERGVDVRGRLLTCPLPARALVCVFVGLLVVTSFTFNVGGGFMYANY
jgi:D-alanyl-lipoteichoic acid acyltransferase DltB (MBOAT superfamily)